ncbi:MAG: HAD family hydrolase [Clostridia bacterium]|nr:HAD family hydrolase [Clostridia bacterium]
MNVTTVFFDLDGTLLPMDQNRFVKAYFSGIAKRLAPLGYEPQALIEAIWSGTAAMIKNDGSRTNETAFWDRFTEIYGERAREDLPTFDAFYRENFDEIAAVCGFSPRSKEIVDHLHRMGIRTVLATNPIFPAVATQKRMRWAGLSPEDFLYYTTYENSRHCKPNPAYYEDILNALGLRAEECLMVGNDVEEDMITETLGMKVFLLTDCLINNRGIDVSRYPHGGFAELSEFLNRTLSPNI